MAASKSRKICAALMITLCASCAGPDAARELSRETLAQVMEYEDSLRAMSRNLTVYYQANITNTRDAIAKFEKTGFTGIRYELAADAVDMVLVDGFRSKQFRRYLSSALDAKRAEQKRFASLLGKAVANQKQALAAVKLEEKLLQTTRAKLEELQVEPSTKDRISKLKPYFEIARKLFNKIKEE